MYNILRLEASSIYNKIYSEYSIENKKGFNISIEYNNKLSSLFKGTMGDSLDINYFKTINKNLIREKTINKKKYEYILDIVSISFKTNSNLYECRYKDYKQKTHQIYVLRGYDIKYDDLILKLKDNVFIENKKVIAVRVGTRTKKANELVLETKCFKFKKGNTYSYKDNDDYKINTKALRKKLYNDGFKLIVDGEAIEYIRYKRSASEAREGNCLFINKDYYNAMMKWSYLDDVFRIDKQVKKFKVEAEAYSALSLSTIIKDVEIDPKSILLMDDLESVFDEECFNVNIKNKELVIKKENAKIKNTIWDGQGLLDVSVFEENGLKDHGMMLLRNRFLKCCAFNTNLQKWFDDTGISSIDQLNGLTLANNVEEIKLIITKSSLKILKFSDSRKEEYKNNEKAKKIIDRIVGDFWRANTSNKFGLVKYDKPTHYFKGHLVQTSYQFINTIGLTNEEASLLIKPYDEYKDLIKKDSSVCFYYLNQRVKDINEEVVDDAIKDDENEDEDESYLNYKSEIAYELLKLDERFSSRHMFSTFVSRITESINKKMKAGKILINGTNATIFGNGYEMLRYAIKEFDINKDEPLIKGTNVMCTMFDNNANLVGARSPHITMGNLLIAKNVLVGSYYKYFNLSKEIICVNAIKNNIQQRLNGMDYDSDTLLITDNKIIYDAVEKNYNKFLVPVNSAESISVNTTDLVEIDYDISNNYVGEIVNLSQKLNSILWDKYNNGIDYEEIYEDICKLAVLSGMEIDKAKRTYGVNTKTELDKIDNKYKNYAYPLFMNKKNKYKYATAMEYINPAATFRGPEKADLSEIINYDNTDVDLNKIEELLSLINDINTKLVVNKNKNFKKNNISDNYEDSKSILTDFYDELKSKELFNYDLICYFLKNKTYFVNNKKDTKDETKIEEDYIWPLLYALYISDDEACNLASIFGGNEAYTLAYSKDKTEDTFELFGNNFKKIPISSDN